MKHYHYHITFAFRGQSRQIDHVPYTDRESAEEAAADLFRKDERPKVRRFDATETCAAFKDKT